MRTGSSTTEVDMRQGLTTPGWRNSVLVLPLVKHSEPSNPMTTRHPSSRIASWPVFMPITLKRCATSRALDWEDTSPMDRWKTGPILSLVIPHTFPVMQNGMTTCSSLVLKQTGTSKSPTRQRWHRSLELIMSMEHRKASRKHTTMEAASIGTATCRYGVFR